MQQGTESISESRAVDPTASTLQSKYREYIPKVMMKFQIKRLPFGENVGWREADRSAPIVS